MNVEVPPEALVRCGNCQALNSPSAIICSSCGVDLAAYQQSSERLQALKTNRAFRRLAQTSGTETQLAQVQIAQGRERIVLLLKIAGVIAAVITLVVIGAAAFLGIQVRLRNERLAATFLQGQQCFKMDDYECAQDAFATVVGEEPNYPAARTLLNKTRFRLAQKYADALDWPAAIAELNSLQQELFAGETYPGAMDLLLTAHYELAEHYARATEWQLAIDQLDTSLSISPGNARATSALRDIYDRWIAYAVSQGDILTVFRVKLQRDARFPPQEN